jgi:hypothetical protein
VTPCLRTPNAERQGYTPTIPHSLRRGNTGPLRPRICRTWISFAPLSPFDHSHWSSLAAEDLTTPICICPAKNWPQGFYKCHPILKLKQSKPWIKHGTMTVFTVRLWTGLPLWVESSTRASNQKMCTTSIYLGHGGLTWVRGVTIGLCDK